jgi:hypothetical protein
MDPALSEQHRHEHPATTHTVLKTLPHPVQLSRLTSAAVPGEQTRDRHRTAGDRVRQPHLDIIGGVKPLLPVHVQIGLIRLQRAQRIKLSR